MRAPSKWLRLDSEIIVKPREYVHCCFQNCNAVIDYARHQLAKGFVFHFPFLFLSPEFS
jgi:hypothetical protein